MNEARPDDAFAKNATAVAEPRFLRWGAVVWPSFFAAAVATMVFFAIVDPIELAATAWPHIPVSRELGYSLGFFGFWACTFGSSLFSALLLGHFFAPARRSPRRDAQA